MSHIHDRPGRGCVVAPALARGVVRLPLPAAGFPVATGSICAVLRIALRNHHRLPSSLSIRIRRWLLRPAF